MRTLSPSLIIIGLALGLALVSARASQEEAARAAIPSAAIDRDALARYSTFSEDNGCVGGEACTIAQGVDILHLDSLDCSNEPASLMLRGPAGTAITVYDSDGYRRDDDWAAIVKQGDDPVCIRTFENSRPGEWVQNDGYRIWYSGGDDLDDSVTSVQWGCWWCNQAR